MSKGYDVDELGALLNDRVQRAATEQEAREALEERGPGLIRVVADLNSIEFASAKPRKETMINAILREKFGK